MKNQNKNQANLNKLFAIILTILIVSVVLLRLTEHKRVSYYVCYDTHYNAWGEPSEERIQDFEEICHRQVYERND